MKFDHINNLFLVEDMIGMVNYLFATIAWYIMSLLNFSKSVWVDNNEDFISATKVHKLLHDGCIHYISPHQNNAYVHPHAHVHGHYCDYGCGHGDVHYHDHGCGYGYDCDCAHGQGPLYKYHD